MRNIIGFSGYSGSGKTTLIEKLVKQLRARGLRVAVVKHDVHGIDIDREGKDSWRFTQAGAEMSVICSPEKTVCIEQRTLEFREVIERIYDVDLILVEGFKSEPIPRIGICRKENGKGFPDSLNRYIAIVTDMEVQEENLPKFGFDDIEELMKFILGHLGTV